MRIVHIGPDSPFVQFAAGVFEAAAPGANEYVIVADTPVERLRHPATAGRVRVVSPHLPVAAAKIARYVRSGDMVVAHAMTRHAVVAFAAARRECVRVWSGWGYEYSGSDADPNAGLLEPLTARLAGTLGGSDLRRLAGRVTRRLYQPAVHRAAASADVFSAPVASDLRVLRSRFPEFRGRYAQICYASVEESFVSASGAPTVSDVLVGNSASPTSNHLDVFEQLRRLEVADRRIVVPLSYGSAEYRQAVVARGTELFGPRFVPLVDLMPLAAYNELVGGCGVVVMNHVRQQALGNIGTALHAGAHVVLNERSPIFEFLRSRGAVLMSMAELTVGGLPDEPLAAADVATNRAVLTAVWGADRVVANVRSLVDDAARSRTGRGCA